MQAEISPVCQKLLERIHQTKRVKTLLECLREYHEDTYDHTCRVALISIELAHRNRLDTSSVRLVGCGALVHDIGKLDVDLAILTKNGRLTKRERMILDRHPRYTFFRLQHQSFDVVRQIAVGHHEYKRKPYPRKGRDRRMLPHHKNDRRLRKEQVEFLTQIVSASDVLDALLASRAYKKAMTLDEAIAIMRKEFKGDPRLIDQLVCIYNPKSVWRPIL